MPPRKPTNSQGSIPASRISFLNRACFYSILSIYKIQAFANINLWSLDLVDENRSPNKQSKRRDKIISNMNKQLGDKTLRQIQTILTKQNEKKSPHKIERKESPDLECTCYKYKSPTINKHSLYQPMEKDNTIIKRQLQTLQNEMIQHNQYKVRNKQSYFLNAKNPKPPLYQRTQQILKERQRKLQLKRQQKQREKLKKELEEQMEMLQMSSPQKKITKYQAFQLTDKLYKDHYSKAVRLNENKMERLKEEAKMYRNKPEINNISKEIFKLMVERQQFDQNVIERFKQYDHHKNNRQQEYQRLYENYFYPFQPSINPTSRMLASKHQHQCCDLQEPRHYNSCTTIKQDKTHSNLSPNKRLKSQCQSELIHSKKQ